MDKALKSKAGSSIMSCYQCTQRIGQDQVCMNVMMLPISEVDFEETVWILVGSDGDAGSEIDVREISYVVWVQ